MKIHALKTWPSYFEAVATGRKTFEIRANDRDYQVGDFLELREWSERGGYTGRAAWKTVTYIADNDSLAALGFGLGPLIVVMGMRDITIPEIEQFHAIRRAAPPPGEEGDGG